MDINMFFMFGCAAFYIFFNCGNVFKNTRIQNKELEKMKKLSEEIKRIVELDRSY